MELMKQRIRPVLKYNIPTLGVLAHCIDRLYPSMHSQLSRQMQETGALLTECRGGTKPERENFPKINRIIAGLSDVNRRKSLFKVLK